MGKRNLILYSSQWAALKHLEDSQLGRVMRQALGYAFDGEVPDDNNKEVAFLFLKAQIDVDAEKYEDKCQQSRDAARSRWTPKEATESDRIPTQATVSDRINSDADYAKEKENKKDNNKDNNIEKKGITSNTPKKEDETASKFSFKLSLIKEGVDEQVAADYMAVRNKHKAPSTLTAFNGLIREADKVRQATNLSLTDIIRICAERGWQGLKADWILKDYNGIQPTPAAETPADPEAQQRIWQKQIEEARAARGEKKGQYNL